MVQQQKKYAVMQLARKLQKAAAIRHANAHMCTNATCVDAGRGTDA